VATVEIATGWPKYGRDTYAGRVEALLRARATSGDGTMTAREIVDAYVASHGEVDPHLITRGLQVVVRDGWARKVGGRLKRTLYAHATVTAAVEPRPDFVVSVLEALRAVVRERGAAVVVGEIVAALNERGMTTTGDEARKALETLAHASEEKARRAVGEWGKPLAKRWTVATTSGRPCVYWAPVEADVAAPGAHVCKSDLMRSAIAHAAIAFERPVGRQDVKIWAVAQRAGLLGGLPSSTAPGVATVEQVARGLEIAEFSATFNNIVGRATHAALLHPAAVHVVHTPFSRRGSVRPRVSYGEPTTEDYAACVAIDLGVMLRPADEMLGIDALNELAVDLDSPALRELALLRRRLLDHLVRAFAPPYFEPSAWLTAGIEKAARGRAVLMAHHGHGTESKYPNYQAIRRLQEEERHADAMRQLLSPSLGSGGDIQALTSVLNSEGLALGHLADLAREAIAISGRGVKHHNHVLAAARRVRGPIVGPQWAEDPRDAMAFLDAPDALLELAQQAHLPRLQALMLDARKVLGLVLRDPSPLRAALLALDSREGVARRAVVVALGLIGAPPELELAVPRADGADDTAAYLAALILGERDPTRRLALIAAADRRACRGARTITDHALMQAEGGACLAILD
jgi:hypothetical protein